MNEETALIKNFNRAERVKADKKRKQEEQVLLQQSMPYQKEVIMQETLGGMQGYLATRQEQIDGLERRERELIDRIQKTQANQNALIQRQVQEVSRPHRSTRDLLDQAGIDLDAMDPLAHEIDDLCARQGGNVPDIHPGKWKLYWKKTQNKMLGKCVDAWIKLHFWAFLAQQYAAMNDVKQFFRQQHLMHSVRKVITDFWI